MAPPDGPLVVVLVGLGDDAQWLMSWCSCAVFSGCPDWCFPGRVALSDFVAGIAELGYSSHRTVVDCMFIGFEY